MDIHSNNTTLELQSDNESDEHFIDINPNVAYVSCIFVTVLVVASLVAMLVNVIIFASIHWIRRPMPPILKISLSLAAADASSSSSFAANLFVNTYLPSVGVNMRLLQLIIEMIRLSGILVTVSHLLALSLNHYIGILKPLHYNSIMTRRKVTACLLILWLLPTLFIVLLFTVDADKGFWDDVLVASNQTQTADHNFMDTFRFRMTFSSFFFVPIIVMAISYTHILIIVRKQQKTWKYLSRCGSTKWSGKMMRNRNSNSKAHREQRQLEGNIRAIYTTLLILGSCVIGWMPALLIYVLMCKSDCLIHGNDLNYLNRNYIYEVMTMRLFENMLVILKMLANPIIYSIRMKEIQESTKRMCTAFAVFFCRTRYNNSEYILASRHSPNVHNGSLKTYKKSSINNTEQVMIGKTEAQTTLL